MAFRPDTGANPVPRVKTTVRSSDWRSGLARTVHLFRANDMPQLKANGLEIAIERFGDASGEPILLIRGLGSQLVHWPGEFIAGFVEKGFHVVAYDNRDAGLSQKIEETGAADIAGSGSKSVSGASPNAHYTLLDMAADAVGVLDALRLSCAHVLGISMGGMILQEMAIHFPERVKSATIVMSSSGAPELPSAQPEVLERLTSAPPASDRENVVAHWLRCDQAWASPAYPFDKASRRELYCAAYDRCYCPDGTARQYAAILADTDRFERLSEIRSPTLVIHGTQDTIFSIEHGRDIAARIPGSELLEVEGMGHDLEGPVPALIVQNVMRLARRAQRAQIPTDKPPAHGTE